MENNSKLNDLSAIDSKKFRKKWKIIVVNIFLNEYFIFTFD